MRVIGAYLYGQLEKHRLGEKADLEASELNAFFSNLNVLNLHIIKRIRGISKGDGTQNALVILDSFASLLMLNAARKA
jgi:hypothetical protein